MKACPFCAEEIQDQAIKCRFCGEWLEERPAEPEPEPTAFDVWLVAPGPRKIPVIKEVRALLGLGLREAKTLVDESEAAPQSLLVGVDEPEAEAWVARFEEAGAEVAVEPGGPGNGGATAIETEATSFDVWLVEAGPNKVSLIKNVREVVTTDLRTANWMVENPPQRLLTNVDSSTAESTVEQFKVGCPGAEFDIRPYEGARPALASVKISAPTSNYRPKCPTCGSPRARRITGGRKAARVAMIGVFAAPKAMKSYECLSCKARW